MTSPEHDGWELPSRFNFTRDVVETTATQDAELPALVFVDQVGIVRRLTFADMAIQSAHWANLLHDVGLRRGDRILVLLGKTPEWHGVLLGALRMGAVAVPCPDMLRAKDLIFRARDSGARVLIADRKAEAEVDAMTEELLGEPLVIYLDEALAHLHEYEPRAPFADTSADETAFILYTSGTTKDPKGVVHTHGWTYAKRMQAEHWLDAQQDDLVWCTAGTGWAKSIWNVLLGPWSCGAETVLHEGAFDPQERLGLIERLGVTVLCQAPTEYRLMAKLDDLDTYDLSRLRHAVAAGEPLNPEVIRVFRDTFDITIYDGYGQTENTLLVANGVGTRIRAGSMGLPTPGHVVEVIDEDGYPAGPGVEGDIALQGRPPTLFAGYWEQPDETAAMFRGDWYITGDRALRDEDGYFWFTGRADDVILSAAYRIGPFEVESALLEHPAVAESAVIGKPDADRGQIVKAFVVLVPGYEPSNELAGSLQRHCRDVTAPYKYPREIEFVDELPKTRSGKIRRVELRQLEEQRAGLAPPSPLSTVEGEPAAGDDEELLPAVDEERGRAEEQARLRAEEEERLRADDEERQRAEDEERARAEAEARARAEEEDRLRAEEDARRQAEEEERRRAEAEERARVEEEARLRAEEERQRAEAEERRRAEEEERARAEEEERLRAEQEERARAEEEARLRADEEARLRAEKEAQLQAAEDQRRRAEEARLDAEEDERRRFEDEARRRAEEDRREQEGRRQRAEADRLRIEREAEEGARIQAEDDARKQAEEVRRRAQEDAQRRAEEAWKALEDARKRAEAERPDRPVPDPAPEDATEPSTEDEAGTGTFVSRLLAYTRTDPPVRPKDDTGEDKTPTE